MRQGKVSIDNVTHEESVNYSFSYHLTPLEVDFRLKYMQAVALVTGDDFLVPFNLTIDTADVLSYIDKLSYKWDYWNNFATFDDFFGIDFASMIGPAGFCFNFNMIDALELFHLDL
jgi:hypothetical protein